MGCHFRKNLYDEIYNCYGTLVPTHNKFYGLLKLRTVYWYNQFGCVFMTQLSRRTVGLPYKRLRCSSFLLEEFQQTVYTLRHVLQPSYFLICCLILFSCSMLVMSHSSVLILVIDTIIRRIQICRTGY
jgi:hypothetical protein